MPTKLPRVNVVLEAPMLRSVQRIASKNGVSVSQEARELIREALELHEDAYWAEEAHRRAQTFDRRKALTHEEVLRHLKKQRR